MPPLAQNASASAPTAVVSVHSLAKAFGPIEVLRDIDFAVLPGEVHVLAGENGAGKSTLIKILCGAYREDRGELRVGGKLRSFRSPQDAFAAGIATIHQELSLVPSMSVADNLFLGREHVRFAGVVDFEHQQAEAHAILAPLRIDVDPHRPVSELPLSARQLLEIARALVAQARLFIFDEPTSALDDDEAELLFERIDDLRRRGCGVIYITHRLEEIYRLADRITVLRDGRVAGTATPGDLPPARLVQWMVGRDVQAGSTGAKPCGEVVLAVSGLYVDRADDDRGLLAVDDVSFELRRGEILGLAGQRGSGTSEVLQALFGTLETRARGSAQLQGEAYTLSDPQSSPQGSIARRVMFLPQDRKRSALALDLSVLHNASLAALWRWSNLAGWIREDEEREEVRRSAGAVGVRAASLDVPVRALSGGNQQKVALMKCLLVQPQVLLLDEPTRGVDVSAKAEIHALLRQWASAGMSILLVTSELEELLALCHRVLVLHRGRIAAELAAPAMTREAILHAAMGGATGTGATGTGATGTGATSPGAVE